MVSTRVSLRNAKLGPKSAKLDLKPGVEPAQGDDPERFLRKGNGARSLREMIWVCARPPVRDPSKMPLAEAPPVRP